MKKISSVILVIFLLLSCSATKKSPVIKLSDFYYEGVDSSVIFTNAIDSLKSLSNDYFLPTLLIDLTVKTKGPLILPYNGRFLSDGKHFVIIE